MALLCTIIVSVSVLSIAAINMLQLSRFRISNVVAIKTVGVSVWHDVNLTIQVSFIDWGVIGPSENRTVVCYVKNEANVLSTLSLTTESWQPTNATTWISLSWNLEGATIQVGEALQADLTLTVSQNIENITTFSFDIVILGSG